MSIDQSAIAFRRKISSFCEMKLVPLTNARQLRALSKYVTGLINDRMPPLTLPPCLVYARADGDDGRAVVASAPNTQDICYPAQLCQQIRQYPPVRKIEIGKCAVDGDEAAHHRGVHAELPKHRKGLLPKP